MDGIGGYELAEQMQRQAERFGAQSRNAQVQSVDLRGNPKVVETSEGTFYAKTVMLATGANPRELGLPEEKELVGRGVAYCAACDGMFYKGKTVVVVGGGQYGGGRCAAAEPHCQEGRARPPKGHPPGNENLP